MIGIVRMRRRHRSLLEESLDDQALGSDSGLSASTGPSGDSEMGAYQNLGGFDHDYSTFVASILWGLVAGCIGSYRICAGVRIVGHPGDPFDSEPASTVDLADGTKEVVCLEEPCLHTS